MSTFSIQLRLRRTTVEDCYISVPVTKRAMPQNEDPTAGGTRTSGKLFEGLDWEVLVDEAVTLSVSDKAEWRAEDVTVAAHPTQGPAPDGRTVYVPASETIDWWEAPVVLEPKGQPPADGYRSSQNNPF
ncbi:MAG: hypothetical protein FWE61_10825 [Micrococcales bacterium]|nr:hypothetical protein [Micrococcales bacterium]